MLSTRFVISALLLLAASLGVNAQALDKHTLQDIERHRAMSQAHEAAAKCLESGKKDDFCEKQLQLSCKGLGIGKFCGMKHLD
ncbi:hypothetical protein HC248_00975 [Polaromonas vacuolata]|uniref:Uncharacterized protein n=1 Tax=Polaromonas vacuolata TaxID=37448 RepID=A0A6H2H7C4_9BURK|nr:hypothetical protein [Polaromonas vacuolata]QJC55693.1 hypothetical protein HC248_00975 [Polaromonas vacuolata]